MTLVEDLLSHGAIFVLWFIVGLSSYYFFKKWTMGSVQTPVTRASKIDDEKKRLVPFLRSCEKETSQPIHGRITGKIPEWLQGTLLRNGPGLMEIGEDKYQHAFDGLAMLHRFFIKDGMATYQNAFLRSNAYKKNIEANRIVCGAFGTAAFPDPCKTLYQRLMSYFKSEFDDDNVNILKIGDQYYAATETNLITRVDPDTLETKEKVDISKFIAVNTATAHAHYESDGTTVNVGNCFTSGRVKYCIMKFPPNERGQSSFDEASILCRIPSTRLLYPSYYHSFAMSTNYCVFIEQSLVISLPRLSWTILTKASPYGDTLQWCPEQLVYFHVVRKDSGEILPITFVADPFVVFHQINAFEEDDHLVVDMCCYKDGDVVKSLYLSSLEEIPSTNTGTSYSMESQARRYIIPLKGIEGFENGSNIMKFPGSKASAVLQNDNSIKCLPEAFFDDDLSFVEMPRINYEKYSGKKYRFFYAVCREKSNGRDALMKGDVVTGKYVIWTEENKAPSEPVFVASPESSSEDDGVVLSALLDRKDEKVVTLLINDAKTFQEVARVDFATSASVPNDFHGIFIS